jgi:hypothetical protein
MNKKIILSIVVTIGLSGCTTNEIATKNITEKVVLENQAKLSASYLKQLSIVVGRLDGMNQAIIQGLSESLDTARLAREMAENAIAMAEKNQIISKELNASKSTANNNDEGEEDEEQAQENDF